MREYARELGRDTWDFAVEVESLRDAGLTNNDLRWLLYQGYVVHAAEVTGPLDTVRCFRPLGNTAVVRQSCYVLTTSGVDLAFALEGSAPGVRAVAAVCDAVALATTPDPPHGNGADAAPESVPLWNKDRRILQYSALVVKQFKVPAPNQEIILATFEEEHWSPHIDDPLPPHPAIDSKRRLHDTINSLNRNQRNSLLRFTGDGSGEGLCWEPAGQVAQRNGVSTHAVGR